MKTDARGNLHDTNGRFAGKPRGDDSDLDSPATDSLSLAHDRLAILLWRTAKVEVPALTLPDTEEILKGMTPKTDKEIEDFSVVVNLKRAWQYLFDHATDWLDWQYVSEYNRLLGQGIVENAGGLRTVGVHVGDYRPPLPRLDTVAGQIAAALSEHEPVHKAIRIYRFWFESAPPFRVEVDQIISACSVVGCTGVWFRFPLRRSYRSSSCGSIGVLPTGIGVGGRRGRA